jgi:hypothetical protein
MHKNTIWIAIAVAALAIACNRPAGEDSAADQQEEKAQLEPAAPPSGAQPPQQQQPTGPTADNVRAPGELRVAEITASPDQLMNETVIVVGEVKDMLGAHAFTLSDESPLGPGQDSDIVVLGAERADWTMDETKGDARMRVRGRLERVPAANLERDLGWKLGDEVQNEIKGEKVVLIAQHVERLEGGEQQRAGERGDTRQGEEREGVRGEERPETR